MANFQKHLLAGARDGMECSPSCLNNLKTCSSVLLWLSSFDLDFPMVWCGPDNLSQAGAQVLQQQEPVRWMKKLQNVDPISLLKSPASKKWTTFRSMNWNTLHTTFLYVGSEGQSLKPQSLVSSALLHEKGDSRLWKYLHRSLQKCIFHPVFHMQKCYTIYSFGWWPGDPLP